MGCAAKFWSQRESAEVAERLFSQIEKENALEQEQPGKVRGRAGGDAPRSRLAIRPQFSLARLTPIYFTAPRNFLLDFRIFYGKGLPVKENNFHTGIPATQGRRQCTPAIVAEIETVNEARRNGIFIFHRAYRERCSSTGTGP